MISGNKEEIKYQIKFDFDSWREYILNGLCIASFIVMIIGFPDSKSHKPAILWLIFTGLGSLVFLGITRLTTDDHLLIDFSENTIWVHNKILFFKNIYRHCSITDISEVKLHTERRNTKHSSYTDFSIHLTLPGSNVRKSVNKVSMKYETGVQFDFSVGTLRDQAVKIADAAGCRVVYSDKIPMDEQLQPGNSKKIDEFSRVKTMEVTDQTPVSSEIASQDKSCLSCGGTVPPENKFCIHCGNPM